MLMILFLRFPNHIKKISISLMIIPSIIISQSEIPQKEKEKRIYPTAPQSVPCNKDWS